MKSLFDGMDNCRRKRQTGIFSIVVPTYNEEKYIGLLLERLLDIKTDNFDMEIIVVDNGSKDNTLFIIKKYSCKVYILPHATIAEMRNYGVQKARGKWIAFIDADCMPTKNWAVLARKYLDNNFKVGIVGSFYSLSPRPTWVEQLWYDMRRATIGKVNFLPAGNMAVRRIEFLQIGGFPDNMVTGEDYALCQRYIDSGYTVINDLSLKNIHFGNVKKLSSLFKKQIWYGLAYQQSFKDNIKSKDFIASCIYLAGSLLVITSILFFFLSNYYIFLWLSVVGLLLISFVVVSYSLVATIRSKRVYFLFGYLLIFFYYFLGKAISLVMIFWRIGLKIS